MAINTVIFDFDGTVINTNQVIINSWQYTYKAVRGREKPVEHIISSFGEPLHDTMKREFPDHDTDKVTSIYREYQAHHYKDMIELFPGMGELIRGLSGHGYNVGIVTSRMRGTTLNGLNNFGLTEYIGNIVTCEDTDKHKPDPEPALIALRNFGVTADEAIMIGDSMYDIKCAHNAGMRAVLVGWAVAVSEEEKAGPDKPDCIIEKAEDLWAYLTSITDGKA
jgi:haloacid dehalogenase superfamily, subfamily IA, variant 3 with third motif having DD or ED/haloacid dehalogenase superfamily, subfamily IA, variant 1 with third motif having Dx(3-4)D or Dx(3-4)E